MNAAFWRRFALTGALWLGLTAGAAETFRVASYNVEGYLDVPTQERPAKAAEARDKVCESILALRPQVLALQEIGRPAALEQLRASLKARGLDLPYKEHVAGFDTNIHVAILSRFPFTACRPHTNEDFLLGGRRFRISRGFGEVDVRVNSHYSFTLITAHLKSRRPLAVADEAEFRLQEAKRLREIIDARFAANPGLNLVVLGDFNDTCDSASIRAIIGRGNHKLVDTRPAEPNGDNAPNSNPAWAPRNITWTHYYGKSDTYSRIDFILLSPGMARAWVTNQTCVLVLPNWGVASDHRPIVATFEAEGE